MKTQKNKVTTGRAKAKTAPSMGSSKELSPIPYVNPKELSGSINFDGQNAIGGLANNDPKPKQVPLDPIIQDGQLSTVPQNEAAVLGGDQVESDNQSDPVATKNYSGHNARETQANSAAVGDDANVIATIQELWRRRQSWHRAEKSLTLQCSAICRRFVGARGVKIKMTKQETAANNILLKKAKDMLKRIESDKMREEDIIPSISCLPILGGRLPLRKARKDIEKELEGLAEQLPIYPWVEKQRGVGSLILYGLVGECGDVGSYKSVSAVWKRMGLAVLDGERQRRRTGVDGIKEGYNPERRSFAWNIGVCLMKSQKATDPYRSYYDIEKPRQLAKGITKKHAHNRACRHMTKRLLANLYGAWRDASLEQENKNAV